MKLIKRLEIETTKLFTDSKYCLGDTKGEYAVVDNDGDPFYMGTKEDCEQYLEDIKDIGDVTSSYEDVQNAINLANSIVEDS